MFGKHTKENYIEIKVSEKKEETEHLKYRGIWLYSNTKHFLKKGPIILLVMLYVIQGTFDINCCMEVYIIFLGAMWLI